MPEIWIGVHGDPIFSKSVSQDSPGIESLIDVGTLRYHTQPIIPFATPVLMHLSMTIEGLAFVECIRMIGRRHFVEESLDESPLVEKFVRCEWHLNQAIEVEVR